jgi:hypothetical protein
MNNMLSPDTQVKVVNRLYSADSHPCTTYFRFTHPSHFRFWNPGIVIGIVFVARNRERERPWLLLGMGDCHKFMCQGMLLSLHWIQSEVLIEIGVLDLVIFFRTSTFSMKLQQFNFFSSCSYTRLLLPRARPFGCEPQFVLLSEPILNIQTWCNVYDGFIQVEGRLIVDGQPFIPQLRYQFTDS